jgi:hypothetical protein
MTISDTPGALNRFRKTQWNFQQTFLTPHKNLPPFVSTIATAHEPLQAGCVTIDQVVFEPKNLMALLSQHSMPVRYEHDLSLTANSRREVEALLQAALSDWIDFIFVPEPTPYVIYADHDEFTTFYANTKLHLNRVVEALSGCGFERVQNYERHF